MLKLLQAVKRLAAIVWDWLDMQAAGWRAVNYPDEI